MKAQELRIGNLVEFKGRKDCYCEVTELYYSGGIHINRYFTDGESDDQPEVIEDITPIPLTEEWLIKFGFKKSPSNNNYYFSVPELKAEVHFDIFRKQLVCVLYCSTGSFIPNDIKYVHQIQNLVHSLTGNELTIK